MNNGSVLNGGTLPAKSSLGDFIKRLTPKYRSRSKSPMMRDGVLLAGNHHHVTTPIGSASSKNGSWVTVEFKNCDDHDHVVRHTTLPKAGSCTVTRSDTADFGVGQKGHSQKLTNLHNKQQPKNDNIDSTYSLPSSPMSASAIYYNSIDFLTDPGSPPGLHVNGVDPESPENLNQIGQKLSENSSKSPKSNGSSTSSLSNFGSFFTRNSLKREKKLSLTGISGGKKISAQAESGSGNLGSSPKIDRASKNRPAKPVKNRFDAFVAQFSHKYHQNLHNNRDLDLLNPVNQTNAASRIAVSEENLVSKSLSLEKSVEKEILGPTPESGSTPDGPNSAHLPATNHILSAPPLYHSQDSVFDASGSHHVTIANGHQAVRVPSYVRLSCTLSGYKNYRSIDLRSCSPSRPPSVSGSSPGSTGAGPKLAIFDPNGPEISIENDQNLLNQPKLPMGKSIVERRLETFNAMENLHTKDSSAQNGPAPTHGPNPVVKKLSYDFTDDAGSPLHSNVPVKDIINNFNKKSPPTVPPRQKSTKAPPSGENLHNNKHENHNNENSIDDVIVNNEKNCIEMNNRKSCIMKNVTNAKSTVSQKKEGRQKIDNKESTNGFDVVEKICPDKTCRDNVLKKVEKEKNVAQAKNFDGQPPRNNVLKTAENGENIGLNSLTCKNNVSNDDHIENHNISKSSTRPTNVLTTVDYENDVLTSPTCGNNISNSQTCKINVLNRSNKLPLSENNENQMIQIEMDGQFYSNLAKSERLRLENLAKSMEIYLNDSTIPEHAAEEIRTIVGKLNLLLRKKFTMFESLIDKNLNPIPDDPRPALNSDLEGYWQLVSIELAYLNAGFDRIEQSRKSDWSKIDDQNNTSALPMAKNIAKKPNVNESGPPKQPKIQQAKEAARQKRLKEAKMAAIERKKAEKIGQNVENDVQFFG